MLIKFIMMINREKKPDFNMKGINIFFAAAAVIIISGWLLNVQELPQFLKDFLPW